MAFVRLATDADIPDLARLLYQVAAVHHGIRPDLFRSGARKYSDAELEQILLDPSKPVFVYEEGAKVMGYAFCALETHEGNGAMADLCMLYIDDLCVDERARGRGIGRRLFEHVKAYAREKGCYNLTLNVWAGNDGAQRFYESMGMKPLKIGMETIL